MPTNLKDISLAAQDQILGAIKTGQGVVLDGVKAWSEVVEALVPNKPTLPRVPGSELLPTPAETVELSFDFAAKVLRAQQEFARNVVSALTPSVDVAATVASAAAPGAKK
jgi:hypothetical protein